MSESASGNLPSLNKLLRLLNIPEDLPRYDAIASASEKSPSGLPSSPEQVNLKDLGPGILDKLKKAGIDESDPRYSEITTQLEALDVNEFGWNDPTDVQANEDLRAKLDRWMSRVEGRLRKLGGLVKKLSVNQGWNDGGREGGQEEDEEGNVKDRTLENRAQVIFTVAAFVADGSEEGNRWQRWISPTTDAIANDILSAFLDPSSNTLPLPLVEVLLTQCIKPTFQHNIHPNLNPTTGRKLPRPAGGPLASQDFYDSQKWKEHPGTGNVLLWCLKHFDREYYEKIWHLLIPPIMITLDDYEAKYKLIGVRIAQEMMKTVPGALLKRTGVDGLVRSALTSCLAHLRSEESPTLVHEAIHAQVELTLLTTRVSEKAYFDQLCDVLGEGIIGGVWFYGYDKEDVIIASVEALPRLVRALGIGSVRYLKVLLTQLIDPLLPKPLRHVPVRLQMASIEALWCVLEECATRIDLRKAGMIVDAVSRCWVTLALPEGGTRKKKEVEMIRKMLRQTCERLKGVCPDVVGQFQLMMEGAPELHELFQGLL